MRAVPFRRSLALLATTALLSSAGVASGLLVGTASAATISNVAPNPATNSSAGTTLLTFTDTGSSFSTLMVSATLKNSANGFTIDYNSQDGAATQPGTPPDMSKIVLPFDLRAQAPGTYDVSVTSGVTPVVHTCTGCLTITGLTPTAGTFGLTAGNPDAMGTYTLIGGHNYARGATVTIQTTGQTGPDPGVTFKNPSNPAPAGTTITGNLLVDPATATRGAHDVIVTNTDLKQAVCTACLTIPRIDSVQLDAATPPAALTLARDVSNKDVIVKGDGFLAGVKARFHSTSAGYGTTDGVTVNAVTLLDSQTLRLNVSVTDSAPLGGRNLTVSNADGGYELRMNALKVTARPLFSATPLDRNNPGVSSPAYTPATATVPESGGTVITMTGTGFVMPNAADPTTGTTFALSPSTGITVNSFTVVDATTAKVNLSIAKDAPRTARAFTLTNPDFGSSAGGTAPQASITPSAAPVLTGVTPTSASANTIATPGCPSDQPNCLFLKVQGTGISSQVLTGNTTPSAAGGYNNGVHLSVLLPDGTVDRAFTIGAVTVNPAGTEASAPVSIAAGAAPGARRVVLLDKNLSSVECFTSSNGPCFNVDTLGVSSIAPVSGTNDGPVNVTIAGSGFGNPPPAVKLERTGQPDIVGTNVVVNNTGTSLTATFDLTGANPQAVPWSVRVTNADGATGVLRDGFAISGLTPRFTSVSPSSVQDGSTAAVITVKGTNLARGMTLAWKCPATATSCTPDPVTTASQYVDKNTYQFTLNTVGVPTGARNIVLVNADGKKSPDTDCGTPTPAGGAGTCFTVVSSVTAPAKPQSVSGTRGDKRVDLTWAPPASSSSPVTSYTVTVIKSVDGSAVSPTITYPVDRTQTGAAITGLTNGTFYTFSVTATSSAGTGQPGDNKPTLRPATRPDAPTGTSATAGPGSATVSFLAPVSDGGEPITSYRVTSSPGSVFAVGTASPITVNGLTVGTTYTFSVVATNAVGDSAPSSSSNAVVPVNGPPGAPANLAASATRAAGTVDLTWSAPPTPPSPVTSYTVTVSPNAGTVTYPSNRVTTGAVVTGLTNGTQYAFTVVANSTQGASAASNSAQATPYGVPGTVRSLSGSVNESSGVGTIVWSLPVSNGGSPITQYAVSLTPSAGTSVTYPADRSQTGATVSGLTSGTDYFVSVVATNLRGSGDPVQFGPLRSGAASTPPVPTFKLGTSVIAAGQHTKVVINGTAGDRVQVLVKGAASSSYTLLATLTVNSAGVAALAVSPGTTSSYVVRNAMGTTAAQSLLVKAVQSIAVQASGRTGIFTGHVAPSLQGRTVTVYYYVDGGHVQTACVTKVGSGGQFTCTKAFPGGSFIHAFAQTGADRYNAAGRSSIKDLQLGR